MKQETITAAVGAAYIRVSTDEQTELSPTAQLRMIQKAAMNDGFSIPEEFIFIEKKGISGRHAENRPEFLRMIALAKSARPAPFSRLYLWKFSRFARNQEESIFYKGILRKKCGVEIKSISEPIMEGMFGRLIETIIEWSDEYYSINLSGEVLRGMTEKTLQKGYQTSPCLGYRAAGEGRPFLLVPSEIKIVEKIFLDFHEGASPAAIARELNFLEYHTKRGNSFDSRSVLRILKNPFYAGTVIWNGHQFQGTHQLSPLLSSLYESNQKKLQAASPSPPKRLRSPQSHWLSGLLTCGFCGANLSSSRPLNGHGSFQCWKYGKGIHKGSCYLSFADAEQALFHSLRQLIRWAGYESRLICLKKGKKGHGELQKRLEQIKKKEERIRTAYESGIDTLEEYKVRKAKLKEEQNQHLAVLPSPSDEKSQPALPLLSVLPGPDMEEEISYALASALPRILSHISVNRKENRLLFFYLLQEKDSDRPPDSPD